MLRIEFLEENYGAMETWASYNFHGFFLTLTYEAGATVKFC